MLQGVNGNILILTTSHQSYILWETPFVSCIELGIFMQFTLAKGLCCVVHIYRLSKLKCFDSHECFPSQGLKT